MDVDTRLSGRTLGDVIAAAARLGHEGDLLVRDRERRTHKLTLRLGNVVAVWSHAWFVRARAAARCRGATP